MRRIGWSTCLFAVFTLAASVLYLRGVPDVPFHPDESTYLFMSGEIARLMTEPEQVYWTAENTKDTRQHYRIIDAPLMRYLLEAALAARGLPAKNVDWNWSQTWEQNQEAGAVPDPGLLRTGRWGAALLYPFDLLLIYAIGRKMEGNLTGWLAALLLAGNALVLLHTRRIMAEGALLFTTLLATWALVTLRRHNWLAGLPVALAVSAKHSAVALLIPGLVAAFWPHPSRLGLTRRAANAGGFLAVFAVTVLALNPFLWAAPLRAVQQVWQARSQLTDNMIMMVTATSPELVQHTIPQRMAAEIAQLFITRPAIMDVANYSDALREAMGAYLDLPVRSLLRSQVGGGLLLGAVLLGMILAGRRVQFSGIAENETLVLLITATLALFLLLGASIPVPFQRYYLPLVPFTCLWAAYGIADFVRRVKR